MTLAPRSQCVISPMQRRGRWVENARGRSVTLLDPLWMSLPGRYDAIDPTALREVAKEIETKLAKCGRLKILGGVLSAITLFLLNMHGEWIFMGAPVSWPVPPRVVVTVVHVRSAVDRPFARFAHAQSRYPRAIVGHLQPVGSPFSSVWTGRERRFAPDHGRLQMGRCDNSMSPWVCQVGNCCDSWLTSLKRTPHKR